MGQGRVMSVAQGWAGGESWTMSAVKEFDRGMVGSRQPSEGFTQLYLKGRLDLTVESLVLEEKFRELFTDELLEHARSRLREYGVEA
jgi:hypothetical protein